MGKKMMTISLYCQVVYLVMCYLLCFSGFGHSLEPAMYLFGSSVLDMGTNNYLTGGAKGNYYPYGIDYPGGEATGRFSNGKNAADFLVEMVGVPSPKPSLSISNKSDMVEEFLKGVNFASGGSGVLNTTNPAYCMTLSQQIGLFNEMVEKTIDKIGPMETYEQMKRSYIVVNIGNNDISIAAGTGVDPEEYASLLITTLKPHLQNIYNIGGRRFVIISSGAQGCLPRARTATGGCSEETNKMAKAYNTKLASLMKTLQSEANFGPLYYSYFDLIAGHELLNAKRESLGFTEGVVACCGTGAFNGSAYRCGPGTVPCDNRANHIYWDNVHYTERFTGLLMKLAFYGSSPYVEPINVNELTALTVLSPYPTDQVKSTK
ncbi:GDSL esterase/lipase At4g28780-like [Dioscorea cayenensis subsp. rotundata]|uniref:GDSL esterase/lipase At4g28780-like n=1 Tax=Dioscorea cayennensis subsp. rotundata TaxID=55577 RepID=A0AB40CLW0_DIOCR|nr:GDSL esterase/lipase At4g28780-like [Dioscorea cayenensis subsp. rotundata]